MSTQFNQIYPQNGYTELEMSDNMNKKTNYPYLPIEKKREKSEKELRKVNRKKYGRDDCYDY